MGSIFHVYASQGRDNYVELDLPASGYEMLDMMERLQLEPGQLPYVEVLKFREDFDYLERCLHEQPDIYQLNALAKKLSEFTSVQDMAAFEGLVGKEIGKSAATIELPRLIDFAHSADCCVVAEDAMTDFQLGKFLVENDFIEDVSGLPDSMLALLDYGKIGREHRAEGNGVYTSLGYAEQQSEVRCVSKNMDFQPKKPGYTILLNIAATPLDRLIQQDDMVRLELPASEEQVQSLLERLGRKDWSNVICSVLDSPIPALNHQLYLDGEAAQLPELSQCLRKMDERGELCKYKAVLSAQGGEDVPQMVSLADTLDEYIFDPSLGGPEDVARGELNVILCERDAEALLPYIDLQSYGRALLARDQAVVTSYGLVERDTSRQVLEEDQAPEGGMEMV